nr:hypothetical protein BaRGS_022028 [Batillaria attramentaria]
MNPGPSYPTMPGQPGVQQFMGAPAIQRMGNPMGPMGPISMTAPQPTMLAAGLPTQTPTPAPTVTSAPAQPAQPPKQVDVSDLLSKLLAAGIIKSEKKEEKAATSAAEEPKAEDSTAALKTESPGPSQPAPKPKPVPKKETLVRPPDLSDFQSFKLKKQYSGVVHDLYDGIQCSSCGCRFAMEDTERYRQHLDWHFRLNKREKEAAKVASFRKWYFELNDWILYQSIEESEENLTSALFEEDLARHNQEEPSATFTFHTPAGVQVTHNPTATGNETEDVCVICGDPFEQYWDEEAEEWHLRNAVGVAGKTYHPVCFDDARDGNQSDVTPTPVVEMAENPLVAQIKQQTDPGVSGTYTELDVPPRAAAADSVDTPQMPVEASVNPAVEAAAVRCVGKAFELCCENGTICGFRTRTTPPPSVSVKQEPMETD